MVDNHYRWDFIGLSTDVKPTPETSEKVVDGSTFYCSDTSKLYVYCKDNWYERKPLGGGGGGGTTYTAGAGINIADDTISVDTTTIQSKLTAGSNVTISDNTISATDTTYSNFTGTDGTSAGTAGLVPAPTTTDAGKFLKADGTWDTAGGGSSVNVVQSIGTSTTDVMSQNVTTLLVYPETNKRKIAMGNNATASGDNSIAIGRDAYVLGGHSNSIAIGRKATTTRAGELNIGSGDNLYGYNNTAYRVIGGVHDGQDAHDAVTVEQVNGVIDAINTALNTNISHIGTAS